jgi:hypothetical protein
MKVSGLPLVGRGAFSRVYKKDARTVLIVSRDKAKEAMASAEWPPSRLFPRIKKISEGYYEALYYPKVRSLKETLKPRHYALYRHLVALSSSYTLGCGYRSLHSGFSQNLKGYRSQREAILGALDALANYSSDVCFEISPRNVATTPSGNLILLDCFFFRHQLRR